MSENEIGDLLSRYAEGLTTLEEEECIHTFMLQHPTHFLAPWFTGTRQLKGQKSALANHAFRRKSSVTVLWHKRKLLRIAATVVLICAVGIMIVINNDPETITVTSAAATQQITLPDGSVVTLNRNTTLRYSRSFTDSRELWLDRGEAFFEVESDPDSPFIVHTGEATTRVTGTSFNVRRSDPITGVTVLSGQVVFGPSNARSGSLALAKGMMGEYNAKAKQFREAHAFDVNELAWKTHKLEFKDARLESVVNTLEHYFQIRVNTEDSTLLACRFRGVFENPKLDEIAKVMDYSLNVKLNFDGSAYTLSGPGCNP